MNPKPSTIKVPLKNLDVPLVTPGRLEAPTRELYALLGLEIDLICIGGEYYSVPSSELTAAQAAIRASKAGAPLARQTRAVPVGPASIPQYQPQLAASTALLYEALGIETVDLVMEAGAAAAETYTVLLSHLAEAKVALRSRPASALHASKAPACSVCATHASLQDFYQGTPPPAARALARLCGVRFLRVSDDKGELYWVTMDQPGTYAIFTALGLYA